jgi:hypothetical protein
MVAVKEISWEEASAPGFETTTRRMWREAVAEIAERAKQTLPDCTSRVDKAVALVLNGDVELLTEGKAKVASQSNGTTEYVVCNGSCECKDFSRAPSGWCKHRIAAGMQKRAQALMQKRLAGSNGQAETARQPVQMQASPAPLPEAPASVNVYLTVSGRQVQLTLRDNDESRLLARLDVILQRFPGGEKPADDTPQCPKHGVPMKLNHKDGRSWGSHKTVDGWCKGK